MSYKITPKVATMREFLNVDTYNKKHHPIQFFIKDTIPDLFAYKKYYIKNKVWEFKHRWVPKHNYSKVHSGLADNAYHDIPELMLHVNFKFLERYIVAEDCFNTIVWQGDGCEREFVASELEDLWYWWKEIRPRRLGVESFLYSYVSDRILGEATKKDRVIYKELNRLEIFWQEEDTYNLKRLVVLRSWMWS